jgi:vacuolar-type H+-ATPase subunit I/STV1
MKMTKSKIQISTLLTAVLFFLSLTSPVLALNNSTSTTGGNAGKLGVVQAKRMELIKARANEEINRRIKALDRLSTRVQGMKRVSDAQKNNIASMVAGEKSNLESLRAKISADSDLETLKTDARSILTSYRIFALVMPQGEILVAADRIKTIADNLTTIGEKLKSRINEAKNSGKDVSLLESKLADYEAKIADAISKADGAINGVSGLTPDNGDAAKAAANRSALQAARENIRKGMEDLRQAREDARKIVQGLKAIGAAKNASASSTVPHE